MCIRDRWYIMPAQLHSPDGRIKRRQRFALGKIGDIVLRLPWLMAHTINRRRDWRHRDAANEALEEAKIERASSACRHAGRVKVAAAVLARATGAKDGNVPPWRPNNEHTSDSCFAHISSYAHRSHKHTTNTPYGARTRRQYISLGFALK